MPVSSLTDDEHTNRAIRTALVDRSRPVSRLPVYLTSFVGRKQQITQGIELLRRDDVRLLTLTGPGGIGKTRLALRLASEVGAWFPNGIYFVPLADVTEPQMLLPTVARAIDVPEFGNRPVSDILKSSLRDRRLLLILDNFEQLIDAAAQVTDLIAHCPGINVIVTSRTVLRVQGEQEFPVPPLTTPARGPGRTWHIVPLEELSTYDAIALFVHRATSVQPAFTLTDDNALAVAEICTRLDGLPLAIELAAARVKILTPSLLLTRLTNRLQVLTAGARDQPERLRTMRNAIAWSYDLLDPTEQTLFQFLAVFANGFTLEAAEAVVKDARLPIDTLDGIATLVDNSLLRETDQSDNEHRFRMLATIREYGLEQLATGRQETAARRRHADWCVALAERAAPELGGPNVVWWLDRLEREHDNITQALGWLLDTGDVGTCARLSWAIWTFWFFRCHFREARDWLERILEHMPETPSSIHSRTLLITGVFTEAIGHFAEANEKLEAGRRMATDLGDKACVGLAMLGLGDVADNTGKYEQAEHYLRSAADLFRETDLQMWRVLALAFLGSLAERRGDPPAGRSLLLEALSLSRQIGFPWGTAISLNRLGRLARNPAHNVEAEAHFRESLEIWHKLGDRWRISRILIDFADLANANRHFERAACLLGAAVSINESIGASESFVDDTVRQRALTLAREQLDAETFATAWATGQAMSWDEAVELANDPGTGVLRSADGGRHKTADYSLTAREMEVLQLLAAGYSDRQIAEELFISRRTAQGHVAGIFNKLGVNSRTAAASTAIGAGLIKPKSLSS